MKNVISIGNLEPRKQPTDFIEIAREVMALTTEEVSFFWVGEGHLLEKCKNITASDENIHFLGFISEEKKKDLLNTCDVYVSTSEHEGFNLTIGEALLLRKPVVAYALPVYRAVYKNHAYLIPLNMKLKFAQTIIRLLENPPFKEPLEDASVFIQTNYSPSAIRKRLLTTFSDIIREKNPHSPN